MSLKRNKQKKRKVVKIKRKMKYYPVIFCTGEKKIIGFSKSHIPLKADRTGKIRLKRKVSIRDWNKNCTGTWLSQLHEIDMHKFSDGDLVLCPHCAKLVDFRIFPSLTEPKMITQAMKDRSE